MTDASSNSAAEGECGFIYSPARPPCRLPKGHDGPHIGKHEADAIPNRATVCERCGSGLIDGKHIASYPPCNGEDATRNRVRAWSADYLAGWRAAMTEARGGDWSQEFPDA